MSETADQPYRVLTAVQLRDMAITNADYALFRPDTARYWANVVNKDHAETLVAETHEQEADLYLVLAGEGELYLGGVILDLTTPTPGQQRGTGISGATRYVLHAGDIAHIPAGTPHLLDVRTGCLTYVVVKIALKDRSDEEGVFTCGREHYIA